MELQSRNNSKFELTSAIEEEVIDIAEYLSSEEIYIINIFDLKEFLHYRGINMKYLYRI